MPGTRNPGVKELASFRLKWSSSVAANVAIAATMTMGITDLNTVERPLLHSIAASVQYMCRSGDKRTWVMLLRFHFCTKSRLQCNACAKVAVKDKRKHKFFRIFVVDMNLNPVICMNQKPVICMNQSKSFT